MTHGLKIEIDDGLCIGSGNCELIAPAALAIGEENVAVVLDPSAESAVKLQEAAEACPAGAIRLIVEP